MNSSPEHGPPVVVDYHKSSGERDPETVAQNDDDLKDSTSTGTCPFVVHSFTGEQLVTKSLKALIAIAMNHMDKTERFWPLDMIKSHSQYTIIHHCVPLALFIWTRGDR